VSEPRDNCQCRLVPIGRGVTIEFCPMHAAAPELLEALKAALRAADGEYGWVTPARIAIDKAEGRR